MNSVVIVPGLNDSGPQHWQTHWQARLGAEQTKVARVRQSRWDEPDLDAWTQRVIETVDATGPSWLVAHSFGCLASVNALASIEAQVRGILLVAPADPDKFGIADRLVTGALPVRALMVASLSDPWLSWGRAEQWAQRWQIPILSAGYAGHINAESGHGAWRDGWDLFRQFRQRRPLHAILPHSYLPLAV